MTEIGPPYGKNLGSPFRVDADRQRPPDMIKYDRGVWKASR
jgi:hypothetical protein